MERGGPELLRLARRAMNESLPAEPPPRPIEHAEALRGALVELAAAPRIALDAEGDGFYRYRARLCTLQLGTGTGIALVDTLAIEDLSALAPLLGAEGPVKVVHDASFDAKMLAGRGLPLTPVFDTAVAARFLGESATGLASLLSRHLGVELEKEQQQADWGKRPLSEERLAYLVADVAHLLPLASLLEQRLGELDLLEEAEEESRYVLARALEPETERAPWTRIKGARDLPPRELSLLTALTDVREREAEARNVPPFRVAPNAALFEAARRGLTDVRAMRRIRGLRGLAEVRLEEAIELSRRGPPVEDVPPPPPPEERAARRAREKALIRWRQEEAARRGLNEQAILPGHCLRDLARPDLRSPDDLARVEGLGAKRIERYGAALLAILA